MALLEATNGDPGAVIGRRRQGSDAPQRLTGHDDGQGTGPPGTTVR